MAARLRMAQLVQAAWVLGVHAGSVDSGGSSLPWATCCGLDARGPFTDGTLGPWVSAEDRAVSPKSPQ